MENEQFVIQLHLAAKLDRHLFYFLLYLHVAVFFFSPHLSVGVIIWLFAAIFMFVLILQCTAVGCFSLIFPLEDHTSLYNVSGIFYLNSCSKQLE